MIVFLTISLVPLCLVSHLSYRRSRDSLQKSITENLAQITADKAASISNWVFERVSDAKVIARSPRMVEMLVSSPAGRGSLVTELTQYLKLLKASYGCYDEIFVLDGDGDFVMGTDREEPNKSDEDYFLDAISGKPRITGIRVSEFTGRPTMLVSHPIRNGQDRVIGVLVERIRLGSISEIMRNIKVGETGESYLLNKEGYFLTESKFRPDCILKQRALTQGYEDCLRCHKGAGKYVDYRGEPVLGSYLWMPDREWCLMVEQDVDEAFSRISRLNEITIAICLIAVFLVVGVSVWVSHRIVRVLEEKDVELDTQMRELVKAENLVSVGKLAAGVVHEISNPLAGIMNYAKLIGRELGEVEDSVHKHLDAISREASRCIRIVRDFLDFTERPDSTIREIDVNQIIENMLLVNVSQFTLQEVIVIKELGDIPRIQADSVQMGQVFTNIILNSIAAMPDGGKLRIQTLERDNHVEIIFSDTGIGIKEEHCARLFEPFFTTKPDGTGLGLSVVKDIVDRHKGSLEVESEVGKGTKFTINLPIEAGQK